MREHMTTMDLKSVRNARDLDLLRGSRFFDGDWYLRFNPDVADAGFDPALHFLQHGGAEGRDPGPHFSAARYLAQAGADAEARSNPLLHFLRRGLSTLDGQEPDRIGDALAAMGVTIPGLRPAPTRSDRDNDGPVAVFVTHSTHIGGAPAVLLSIADWFRRHTNYQVRIVSMSGGPWMSRFIETAPTFLVGELDVPEDRVEARRADLRAFIGGEPAFTFINSVAAGGYCRVDPYDAPRLAYIHELPKIVEHYARPFEHMRDAVQHFLCDGPAVAAALTTRYGIPESRTTVRECFIDLPEPVEFGAADRKRAQRAALGWPPDAKVVMGCGVVHWRKQPDVFVRAAAAIGGDVRFVWIGAGEDLDEMRRLAESLGVGDRVEFLGHRDDYRALLQAADIFALPSVEDPFPLVCLEAAAASAPSVIFREAGGMSAFVEPDGQPPAGLAVTLGDEDAYVAALRTLVEDDEARTRLARVAHDRVHAGYTVDHGCMEILKTIRAVAALPPLVSVVVPVYNSEAFLDERLRTIAAQSFKDVEIVLRDDCSTDASVAILTDFASRHPLARLERADVNGGSVFRAWARCIEAARGDLVWIAEADDACEPEFLRAMVAAFAVPGVRLAYGRSSVIDGRGRIVGDYRDSYLRDVAPGYWDESRCTPARQEINRALGRRNTIPNASAVVVRRSAALRAVPLVEGFTIAGDWAFYAAAIHGGRVAYAADAVNLHRRHEATVTRSLEGTVAYFHELASVGRLIRHLYGPDQDRDQAFDALLEAEAARFGVAGALPEGELPPGVGPRPPPGILYGIGDLSGGGAQMFAVRFVNGWIRDGAPAVLFNVGYLPDHPSVRGALSPEVPIVTAEEIMAVGLRQVLDDWGLQVVVSGHWWADMAIGRWLEAMEADPGARPIPPWIIVMHGCYENALDNPEEIHNQAAAYARAERHCALWVWTADKNRRLFDEGHVRPRATTTILNGFEPVAPSGSVTRRTLGIADGATVFTLASRAIEEKGWLVARDAFEALVGGEGGPDAHLLLIGDGPAAALAREGASPRVHLVSHTSRLADYIAISDVGLLPSWFSGESLPLVLIEFLAQGRPAIVSDIGRCALAVDAGALGTAGLVLAREPTTGRVAMPDILAAMRRFAQRPDLARELEPAAREAFRKFAFPTMLAAYREAMAGVLTSHTP